MSKHRIFSMSFVSLYPMYLNKAERKNHSKAEVNEIIYWLTGYDEAGLQQQLEQNNDVETFFAQAPKLHANTSLIKGVAKGKAMEKILRQ